MTFYYSNSSPPISLFPSCSQLYACADYSGVVLVLQLCKLLYVRFWLLDQQISVCCWQTKEGLRPPSHVGGGAVGTVSGWTKKSVLCTAHFA